MGTHGKLRSRTIVFCALALLVLAAALAVAACGSDAAPTDLPTRTTPVAAYSFPPQESLSKDAPRAYARGTDGIEFVPWADIEVTDLGYYDDNGDGLLSEHTVGVFEKSSQDLVSDTVTIEGGSTLKDGFRYETITPVVLKGGTSYVLAGGTSTPYDLIVADPSDAAWAPEVRFTELLWGRSASGEAFRFPRDEETHFYATLRSAVNFMFRTPASPASAATP